MISPIVPSRLGAHLVTRLAVIGAAAGCLMASPASALTITPIFDASITSNVNAAKIESAVNAAAVQLGSAFSNRATVKINVSWGSAGGQSIGSGDIASSTENLSGPYTFASIEADIRSAAAANPANAVLQSVKSHLPAVDPTHGLGFRVPYGEAQAIGLLPAAMGLAAGAIGFSSSTSWDFNIADGVAANAYDLRGAAEHEIMEVLGRVSGLGSSRPTMATPLDLFRYSAPGVSSFSYTAPAYFSTNGGVTHLQDFNVSGSGDRSDVASALGLNDVQNAFLAKGAVLTLSSADLTVLDALGWGVFTMPRLAQSGLGDGGSVQSFGGAVPEPAIWLMMVTGFMATGRALRRRAINGLSPSR